MLQSIKTGGGGKLQQLMALKRQSLRLSKLWMRDSFVHKIGKRY